MAQTASAKEQRLNCSFKMLWAALSSIEIHSPQILLLRLVLSFFLLIVFFFLFLLSLFACLLSCLL